MVIVSTHLSRTKMGYEVWHDELVVLQDKSKGHDSWKERPAGPFEGRIRSPNPFEGMSMDSYRLQQQD